MPYNPHVHHRRSIRLKNYDYSSPGSYYITVCVAERQHVFVHIQNRIMHLNMFVHIVQECWYELPQHYPHVHLDAWVVMPDHIHGIIVLTEYTDNAVMPEHTRHALPEIVRALKSFSARRINILRNTIGTPLWQRNYYDCIIRDQQHLHNTRQYIANNPARWAERKLPREGQV